RLDQQLNPKHPLFRLAQQIDWRYFERESGAFYFYLEEMGRPGEPARLLVGLHNLNSDLERKRIEPKVLTGRGKDLNAVRAVQQFIGEGGWGDDRILERHQQLVVADLGEQDGTVIVEGVVFRRKGNTRSECNSSIAERWANSPIASNESFTTQLHTFYYQ